MTRLRAVLFAALFYPVTVALALAALPLALVPGMVQRVARLWAQWFLFAARIAYGVRLAVRGRVPATGLVAVKHQSMYETLALVAILDDPVVVMKAELRRIPVWGWLAARHGAIFVERKAHARALKDMLRAARRHHDDGRPLLIFPEGTRVAVGSHPPLKSGIVALYRGLDLPVIPVALDAGRVWRRDGARRPGVVTIAFLPAVPPGLARADMMDKLHAAINSDPVGCAVRDGAP